MQVAVLTGGPSAEREISLQSAQLVMDHLDREKYTPRLIIIESHGWFDQQTGARVSLNDFSLRLPDQRYTFDFVFLMIHGTPAEDGKIQGYFEMLGLAHSTCHTLSAALTFNKQKCKDYLRTFEIPMARSVVVHHSDTAIDLAMPVFVKPNKNGSSYGVSRVSIQNELPAAIKKALQFDNEVIVEEFISGTEYGCGVLSDGEGIVALPLTEIIPEGDFFDYEAKYLGASQEITPARLSADAVVLCQDLSKELYQLLDCRGVVRFDYIRRGEDFILLEANTIPGMSAASIVPQQAKANGWSITELLDKIIKGCTN